MYVWIAAIPILLLAASLWRGAHYRELIRSVDHTREIQGELQNLLVSLTDAETGRRGYILTGDPSYLAEVDTNTAEVSAIVHRLSDLTQDDVLRMLTSNAAEIMGVAQRAGSIEAGKDADFVVFSGHPLKVQSKVEEVYIEGENVYRAADHQLK